MKTSQDLFKQLDEAESLFSKGSIKVAQKKVREVISKSKELDKIPNKLRHKINFAIGQSRYFDDMSSFATNPKREELIKEISTIIQSPLESPKKQAHLIHNVQTKWQLLDLSSRPASKEQWNKFNELTNTAWEPCSEYFDELKQVKINNAAQRMEIINNINQYVQDNSSNWPQPKFLIQFLRTSFLFCKLRLTIKFSKIVNFFDFKIILPAILSFLDSNTPLPLITPPSKFNLID